jgi:hypothetical protein
MATASSVVWVRASGGRLAACLLGLLVTTVATTLAFGVIQFDAFVRSAAGHTPTMSHWPEGMRLQALGAGAALLVLWSLGRAGVLAPFAANTVPTLPVDEGAALIALLAAIWGIAARPPSLLYLGPAAIIVSSYTLITSTLRGRSAAADDLSTDDFMIAQFVSTSVASFVSRAIVERRVRLLVTARSDGAERDLGGR